MTFSKILVTTDFSPGANTALDAALSLAKRLQASVHVLHVVEDPVVAAAWSEAYAFDVLKLREDLVADAGRRLASIATADPSVHLTTEVAVGRPAETIVRTAADRGADLIVVGTHGRSGVTRMLMGSIAERVVRHAECPVLVARAVLAANETHQASSVEVQATA